MRSLTWLGTACAVCALMLTQRPAADAAGPPDADEAHVLWREGYGLTAPDVRCSSVATIPAIVSRCMSGRTALYPSAAYDTYRKEYDPIAITAFESARDWHVERLRCEEDGNPPRVLANYGPEFVSHPSVPHEGRMDTHQFGRVAYRQWITELICPNESIGFILVRFQNLTAPDLAYDMVVTTADVGRVFNLAEDLLVFDELNENLFNRGILLSSEMALQ